jgi:nitrous oxidase accessory protein
MGRAGRHQTPTRKFCKPESEEKMKFRITFMVFLLMGLFCSAAQALPSLQVYVQLTPEGQTLKAPPGVYAGPLRVNRSIVIEGNGEVTIDGGGKGTVVIVTADGAEIHNLHIINSGNSHDSVDAGILIEADNVVCEGNVIEEVLFGIHLQQADGCQVRGNTVTSRPHIGALRGDGLRLWYSSDNLLENNDVTLVRDVVLQNSTGNVLRGNKITHSRMGIELIYGPENELADNILSYNEHGIVAIYSDEIHVHGNRIEHQSHLLGSAVAVKGSSQCVIEKNEFLDCVIGITANSPMFPENLLYIRDNTFAYNDIALYFYGDRGGHVLHGNRFNGNFEQVAVTASTSAVDNDWRGNYWQDYQGFDRNHDGVGDTPYSLYLYSSRLWMDRPMAKFFRGSPVLEIVDLVERLLSFADPELILSDEEPKMK